MSRSATVNIYRCSLGPVPTEISGVRAAWSDIGISRQQTANNTILRIAYEEKGETLNYRLAVSVVSFPDGCAQKMSHPTETQKDVNQLAAEWDTSLKNSPSSSTEIKDLSASTADVEGKLGLGDEEEGVSASESATGAVEDPAARVPTHTSLESGIIGNTPLLSPDIVSRFGGGSRWSSL
jgi:hypothetical protein